MEKIIRADSVKLFAYVNDAVLKRPVRGIAVEFMGLGGMTIVQEDTPRGKWFGERGIAYVIPYLNPWSWMNEQAVRETDEILEAVCALLGCDTLPVVSTGGSMGGLASLVYTAKAANTPVACVANCPVCDLPYHYTERPDLPRTLYSAFGMYAAGLETAMRTASPLHLAQEGSMPDVRYVLFHCDEDKAVNKQMHSDRFVQAMLPKEIEYHAVPGRGHCDLTDEMRALYEQRVAQALGVEV